MSSPSSRLVKKGLDEELEGQTKVEVPNPDETPIKELTAFCKEVGKEPDGWKSLKAADKRIAFKRMFLPEEAKTDTFDPNDRIHMMAHEVENMDAEELRKKAKELAETVEVNYLQLGGVLANITSQQLFSQYGHESFKDYVSVELEYEHSKARYLIQAYNKIVELGLSWASLSAVGWTKLRVLIPILDKENADEWLQKAASMSRKDLQDEVKEARGSVGSGASSSSSSDLKTVSFKLSADQAETVEEAIEHQKGLLPTEHKGVALEHICQQWMQQNLEGGASPDKLEDRGDCLKAIERALVRIRQLSDSDYDALEPLVPFIEEQVFPKVFKTAKVEVNVEAD